MPDDFDPTQLTDEQIAAVMTEAGRRYSAMRARHDRRCELCGSEILGAVTKRRYCADACRFKAAVIRKKADAGSDPTAPFRIRLGGKGW